MILYTQTCGEDAGTGVKCELTIDNSESSAATSFALAPYDTVYTNMRGRCRNTSKM